MREIPSEIRLVKVRRPLGIPIVEEVEDLVDEMTRVEEDPFLFVLNDQIA